MWSGTKPPLPNSVPADRHCQQDQSVSAPRRSSARLEQRMANPHRKIITAVLSAMRSPHEKSSGCVPSRGDLLSLTKWPPDVR